MKIALAHNFYQERGGEDVLVERDQALLEQNGHTVFTHFVHSEVLQDGITQKARAAYSVLAHREFSEGLEVFLQKNRPDILHVHNFYPLLTDAVFVVAKKLGVPVVCSIHNYRFECASGLLYREGKVCELCPKEGFHHAVRHRCYRDSYLGSLITARFFSDLKSNGAWKNVDAFILCKEFARQRLKSIDIPENRMYLRRNYVKDFPRVGTFQANGPVVVVGRISQEKGIKTILQAWQPEFPELHFYGDGPERELLERAGKNVHWRGFVSQKDLPQILSQAGAFILGSTCFEGGTPLALIEAMCAALPVFVPQIGGLDEFLVHGKSAMLYRAGSNASLESSLREFFAKNAEERAKLGHSAREIYLKYFSEAHAYESLVDIYRKVIAQSRKS